MCRKVLSTLLASRRVLHDPVYRGRIAQRISPLFLWSKLAFIGRSRPVKLTILIPLVGTFLIFNQYVENSFQFSSAFMRDIGVDIEEAGRSNLFTSSSLYFLYFGLCFVGFGSFLFNAYCPGDIKKEPYISKYTADTNLRENSVVAKSNLQFVLDTYIRNMKLIEHEPYAPNPEYPMELEVDFNNLIHEMFTAVMDTPEQKIVHSSNRRKLDVDEDYKAYNEFLTSMYTGTLYPNIQEIAYKVWSSPKVIWAFTMPFKGLSSIYAKDIAFVMFKTLDRSRYRVRLSIFIFYTIGFLLLLKPTAETFVRLAWHAIF